MDLSLSLPGSPTTSTLNLIRRVSAIVSERFAWSLSKIVVGRVNRRVPPDFRMKFAKWGKRSRLEGAGNLVFCGDFIIEDDVRFKVVAGSTLRFGARVEIRRGGEFLVSENAVEIGDDCYVGPFASISGHGPIRIGDSVMFGPRTVVMAANHQFDASANVPYAKQPLHARGITIGNNVWIAANVVILDGCELGDGVVVGAGAVVRGTFPPRVLIGGVPARILKAL